MVTQWTGGTTSTNAIFRTEKKGGGVVCMTCQHFTYGVDQLCHMMVGCDLRQKQLKQGEHLKKRCKLWAPTWQKEVGWAPEAS